MKNFFLPFLICLSIIISSCANHKGFRKNYSSVNDMLHDSSFLVTQPFLKAHLKNGDVIIFINKWTYEEGTDLIKGVGERFDPSRKRISQGMVSLPVDSVAIFETNTALSSSGKHARIAAISIITALEIGLGLYCISEPKACFGSCPTFYIDHDISVHHSDAEGFSNAILPALEYADIDALNNTGHTSGKFNIRMKNEALETHVVRRVQLYAVERKMGEKIFHSPDDKFYRSSTVIEPAKVTAPEGDCTNLFRFRDKQERFSSTDPKDLSVKEEIFFEFDPKPYQKRSGFILDFRQSLLTTYLFYNLLSYMGDDISDIMAEMQAAPDTAQMNRMKKLISEIAVFYNDQGKWRSIGAFDETGPIAGNLQILPFDITGKGPVQIKIIAAKGMWRFDHAALAVVDEEVLPEIYDPYNLSKNGCSDSLLLYQLIDQSEALVSMPGDFYDLEFSLPEEVDHELFLTSQGYYLEWMRYNWLKDKNKKKLWMLSHFPRLYLKQEAKGFKKIEAEMEHQFWNSKIRSNDITEKP